MDLNEAAEAAAFSGMLFQLFDECRNDILKGIVDAVLRLVRNLKLHHDLVDAG